MKAGKEALRLRAPLCVGYRIQNIDGSCDVLFRKRSARTRNPDLYSQIRHSFFCGTKSHKREFRVFWMLPRKELELQPKRELHNSRQN